MINSEKTVFSNIARYFEIATNAHTKVEASVLERTIQIEKEPLNTELLLKHANTVHSESIITIVFCAMTLEAFINEYGIKNSSKGFYTEHLDNLSLISKLLLIPKLYNMPSLETDGQLFQELKWLIKLRNELTHFKSKEKNTKELKLNINLHEQNDFILEDHARKAIQVMKDLIKLLMPEIDMKKATMFVPYKD